MQRAIGFFKVLKPYFLIFIVVQTLLRISLLVRCAMEVEISVPEIFQIFLKGAWFDLSTAGFALLPLAVMYLLPPAGFWQRRTGFWLQAGLRFVFTFVLLFGFIAEHLFWSEFSTRFNFIAVDYLIYTQEVIGNINESYPVGWLVLTVAALAAAVSWLTLRRPESRTAFALPVRQRAAGFAVCAALCGALYAVSDVSQAHIKDNAEAGEVAANGFYNLFHAFWNNEINYERFYAQRDKKAIGTRVRTLLSEEEAPFEGEEGIVRLMKSSGPERHKNVILVVMESLSADYMESFGNTENLTPNLDHLAKQGLFFTKAYATGTRTVRGLEAVTLSVPPTPGQSIIRRPGNENLFSLGFIFKDRGYDTKFIYGGYGYFDNMNAFFAGNGFDVVDRNSMAPEEIHFANVWGVADDDMFARSLKEADASYEAGKPFMHLIMTTSNHRPYTYPEGKIDIPSKSGRNGGVKYADYSIGKLMEWAEKKPWFKDTVFVFVADHTAGAGGKAELDPKKYHIPMLLYAPSIVAQGRYEHIASQIDLAPILLGQLNFSYRTKFYGEDLIHDADEIPHAFIGNYQKVALVREDRLVVLSPKRAVRELTWPEQLALPEDDMMLLEDVIAYYQSASWWRETYRREPTVIR